MGLGPRRKSDRSPVSRPASGDLHVHTTHSDGACSPAEVVRAAVTVGLTTLAITDHDCLSGWAAAKGEADHFGLELLTGIELTAELEGREIHLLGYGFDPADAGLVEACRRLRESRASRIEAMAEALAGVGLRVEIGLLRQRHPRATLGRKHVADWLVASGQVESAREAFGRYLGPGCPGDVPKLRLGWQEAIDLVRAAGGLTAWAHPPYDLREATLRRLAEGGLGGVEVDTPGATFAIRRRRRDWAEALGLVAVSGSDFHAPDRPGRWVGSIVTPAADLERLRAALAGDSGRADRV